MKTLSLIFFIFSTCSVLAQNEHNIWYFDNTRGIDFNSGAANVISNSAMAAMEGCASICDNNGGLLFYTDGEKIYNSNHQIMPNGGTLNGEESSSLSALIVPKPGSSTEYYVFTSGAAETAGAIGIQYSIVDMTLQGGLGDVTATLNTPVYAPSCEKIAAVQHSNGTDYWIVSHEWQSSNYRSYLLTSSGLANIPVISSSGLDIGSNNIAGEMVGYLKANIDGDKIAAAHFNKDTAEVLDFNNTTGALSNPIYIPSVKSYGVEFSPNGQYLYISSDSSIFQYDLWAGSSINILNSEFDIIASQFLLGRSFALQLAPDGRIYCAKHVSLGAIVNPSQPGFASAYTANGSTVSSVYGLPVTLNKISFLPQNYTYSICEGDSIVLSPNDFTNHNWAFASAPNTVLATTSSFTVSPLVDTDYIVYDGSDTAYFTVTVGTVLALDLGPDIVLCEGDSVALYDLNSISDSLGAGTYNWFAVVDTSNFINLAQDTLVVSDDANYSLFLSSAAGTECTFFIDNIIVTVVDSDSVNILENNPQCYGTATGSLIAMPDSIGGALSVMNSAGILVNSPGSNTANNLLAGTYFITYTDSNGCVFNDTIALIAPPEIEFTIEAQSPLCSGGLTGTAFVSSVLNYQGAIDSISYAWSPNSQNNNGVMVDSIWGLNAGDYMLTLTDSAGCMVNQSFTVFDPDAFFANITSMIPTLCRTSGDQNGNGVLVAEVPVQNSGVPPFVFTWLNLEDGQIVNTDTAIMRAPGTIVLTVTDANNCSYVDTVLLDSINPIADFDIISDQFTGTAPYEGNSDLSVTLVNFSENMVQANNPQSSPIFQWNLFTNQTPLADQNWFSTADIFQEIDTTYRTAGTYQICLIAMNGNSCKDTICKEVIVNSTPDFFTPNIFTPGSAPNSHFFFPFEGIQDFKCTVFNRYGIQVFEFNSISDQWDGSHFKNGNPCSDGVYFYIYEAMSTNGTPFEGEGQLTLIRSK